MCQLYRILYIYFLTKSNQNVSSQHAIQERSGRVLQALSPYTSPRGSPSNSPTRGRSPSSRLQWFSPPSSPTSSPSSFRKSKASTLQTPSPPHNPSPPSYAEKSSSSQKSKIKYFSGQTTSSTKAASDSPINVLISMTEGDEEDQ